MSTTMTRVSAAELKTLDYKRFAKEYNAWHEHAADYDWYTDEYSYFINKWEEQGLVVEAKDICWSGFWSQGDGLAFHGYMRADDFLQKHKYHETHYALWLDVQNYGGLLETTRLSRHGNYISGVDFSYWPGNCPPSGVFQDLDHAAWDELVQEQFDEVVNAIEIEALEFFRGCAQELYDSLEKTYEAITSEQAFIESCEANEITFEIEGDGHEIQD